MAIVVPNKEIKVNNFERFCEVFNIKSSKVAGNDGYDEELIIEELNKIINQKWIVNFTEDSEDGFFHLREIL